MRKQPPFHRPADGLETLQSAQLSSPHASPLAFPTLCYSGPLCHCGGFHSATAQIKPEREKHEKLKLQARRAEIHCSLFVLFFYCRLPSSGFLADLRHRSSAKTSCCSFLYCIDRITSHHMDASTTQFKATQRQSCM